MKCDKYIGCDLHQATTVVAVLGAEGKVVMETIVATEAAAMIRFLKSLSGPLHITFEETTQARWMYDVVRGYVSEASCAIRGATDCWVKAPKRTSPTRGNSPNCCEPVCSGPFITAMRQRDSWRSSYGVTTEYEIKAGHVVRSRKSVATRGLNRNCNRRLKDLFIGAAVAGSRSEPYRSYVEGLQQKGIRAEMARLTLARKIAAVALRVWKKGETFDPKKLNSTP
jgi:hypothetical protein